MKLGEWEMAQSVNCLLGKAWGPELDHQKALKTNQNKTKSQASWTSSTGEAEKGGFLASLVNQVGLLGDGQVSEETSETSVAATEHNS